MIDKTVKTDDYRLFIQDIKQRIRTAQIKAAVAVNQELLRLYWDLAERIVVKQQESAWGDGFLEQMSRDLQAEFPEIRGFSLRNLKYMRQWFRFWSAEPSIGQQLVAQIPWGHNLVIISKIKDVGQAVFYAQKTIQNNWSRAVLTHHIESGLYQREGKAITNFHATLPAPQSDLARQTIKDPYNFDFLTLREKHDEQESATTGKAGGLTVAGPSKGPDRNRLQTLPCTFCRHYGESRKPVPFFWIPAFAGMTRFTKNHFRNCQTLRVPRQSRGFTLRKLEGALVNHVTRFLLELGAGFSYLDRQYRLEIAGDEFFLDLLFYHVRLHCYVVVELKAVKFKPEFAGRTEILPAQHRRD